MSDIEELIKGLSCPHILTTEPDEEGDGICLKCGCVVQIQFNMKRFKEFIRKIRDGEI